MKSELCWLDRTAGFRTTLQTLRGRQVNGVVRSSRSVQQKSDFINIAKSISQDITNTYTKLEKLTLLCKRKTIFDDKPVEIQELTVESNQTSSACVELLYSCLKFRQYDFRMEWSYSNLAKIVFPKYADARPIDPIIDQGFPIT